MKNKLYTILTVALSISLILTACEEPIGNQGQQGPQGPQGLEGPEGPVGPAGEDGSQIYAGYGPPSIDIGSPGDYYLNGTTGELYGPKSANGWGGPIIVLKGEDGEDGSQIYAGSGAPEASLGVEGDYYLDKTSYELYGPKTGSGWGTPLNLKGADGNANVTQYIFGEHDFSASSEVSLDMPDITEEEMKQSSWHVYLVRPQGNVYPVPGWAVDGKTEYRLYMLHMPANNGTARIVVPIKNGSGEIYSEIIVIRVRANNTEELSKQKENSIIPDHLDMTDYREVAEYYGFYR